MGRHRDWFQPVRVAPAIDQVVASRDTPNSTAGRLTVGAPIPDADAIQRETVRRLKQFLEQTDRPAQSTREGEPE